MEKSKIEDVSYYNYDEMYRKLIVLAIILLGAELLLRNTRSRYGSCRPATGVITLSSRLLHFPPEAVETVLAHELAHLVAADHSAAFYAAAEELLPGYRKRARLLK